MVNVLARTPSKLSALASQYPNLLHVIKGDIRDIPSIKETLTVNNQVVDVAISSIGMVFRRQGFGFAPGDTHICEDGTKHILAALSQIEEEAKIQVSNGGPRLVLLSTTGISDKGRDIPVAMIPLYHWMLSTPHVDKKKMEELVVRSGRRWTIIRPSFLGNGAGKGMKRIRISTELPSASAEQQKAAGVAIGYTIDREDVALWIVEECVKGDAAKWEGKAVTLTY